jgi:hypothetical protein
MATWPTTLPSPTSGFSIAPVDQTIRTDMEVGSARVRRRTSARNDMMTTTWLMTNDQVAIFRTWFTTTINGGVTWFTVSLPVGSTVYSSVNARFKGPYTIDHVGGIYWKINGTLEIQ